MKELEKKELVETLYEGYLEREENENKIIIDLYALGCIEELKGKDELLDELNELLIKKFEENGYATYRYGSFYYDEEDGRYVNVNPGTVVAIKE